MISEEKSKAEIEMAQSEERYKSIFELSPEGIVIIDEAGTIIDANDRLYDWLSYTPEEIKGRKLLELPFLSIKNKAIAAKNMVARFLGKNIAPYKIEFTAKSGDKKVGLVNAKIIQYKDGKKVDLIMITNLGKPKR